MKQILFLFLIAVWASCSAKDRVQPGTDSMQHADIFKSIQAHDLERVRQALQAGADVHATDQRRRSLLLLATIDRQYTIARLLVAYGADVNQQDEQQDSPFLYAGASGQTELVQLFLEHGARFDIYNRYNGTALIPACERGHVETVRVLAFTPAFPLDHVNRLGWTALLEAVILGNGGKDHQEIVRILKRAGADLTIADGEGISALQHARSRGFSEIVQILETE